MGFITGFENTSRYKMYMTSDEWKAKREERLALDNNICQVCGRKATDVHHVSYANFGHELMEDLRSLCRECHEEAEKIYSPTMTPLPDWFNNKAVPGQDNFLAAMRIDAENISQIVFDYLVKIRGLDFDSIMAFRQPTEDNSKDYWGVLRRAVDALCRKRYENNVFDRIEIAMYMISNHTIANICVSAIEHNNRNYMQAQLHDTAVGTFEVCGKKRKPAADFLGINIRQLDKFRKDDGSTGGPTLRGYVFYYSALDAAAGIYPPTGFESCLTREDMTILNKMANYASQIS